MKKERFENILSSSLKSNEIYFSLSEKKEIYDVFSSHGMTYSRVYNRFFRVGYGSGFDQWEILGIKNLVHNYEKENGLSLSAENDFPTFYDRLDSKQNFWDYMSKYGMGKNSTIYRFKNWNFQEWELLGIKHIILNELVDKSE